jgi:hypothetical protein
MLKVAQKLPTKLLARPNWMSTAPLSYSPKILIQVLLAKTRSAGAPYFMLALHLAREKSCYYRSVHNTTLMLQCLSGAIL